LRRLETVRSQEEGWQEPCESRGSRTDLWERGGEIPLRYPTGVIKIVGYLSGFQILPVAIPLIVFTKNP